VKKKVKLKRLLFLPKKKMQGGNYNKGTLVMDALHPNDTCHHPTQ
jgi:hypothetical protein